MRVAGIADTHSAAQCRHPVLNRAQRADKAAPALVQYDEPQGKGEKPGQDGQARRTEQHRQRPAQLMLQGQQVAHPGPPFLVVAAGKNGQLRAEIDRQIATINEQDERDELEPETEAVEIDPIDGVTHRLKAATWLHRSAPPGKVSPDDDGRDISRHHRTT